MALVKYGSDGQRVGIVWRGGTARPCTQHRSLFISLLCCLLFYFFRIININNKFSSIQVNE